MDKKQYIINSQIGKVKHSISFYDGVKVHSDGSEFWDLRTFKTKRDMKRFVKQLENDGYKEV
jgi:hypothetical protein